MLKAITWLDRALIDGPYVALCLTEKAFLRALKRLEIPKDQWPEFISKGAGATVHHLNCAGGKDCHLVCIRPKTKHTKIETYALLIHEAVHIWQSIRESMREDKPSSEFEAYSVQRLSLNLMSAYDGLTRNAS